MDSFGDENYRWGGGINPNKIIEKNDGRTKTIERETEF